MSAEHASGVDERAIENDLKAMVVRVERSYDRSMSMGCFSAIGSVVAGGYFWSWKGALLGVVGMAVVGKLATSYDDWVRTRTVRAFFRRYPEGSPAHAVAIQVLRELETKASSFDKLRAAIIAGPHGDLVRRRHPEPVVPSQLSPMEPPVLPAKPPGPVPAPTTPPRTPTSLIPLEPFEPEPAETPEKRDERDSGTRGRD